MAPILSLVHAVVTPRHIWSHNTIFGDPCLLVHMTDCGFLGNYTAIWDWTLFTAHLRVK